MRAILFAEGIDKTKQVLFQLQAQKIHGMHVAFKVVKIQDIAPPAKMNNFFFVLINVYTSINITIILQRNGLMFKTALKLYLTSFSMISCFLFIYLIFFWIGFTCITPVSDRGNSIIQSLNHGGKPNQT